MGKDIFVGHCEEKGKYVGGSHAVRGMFDVMDNDKIQHLYRAIFTERSKTT